eukprot:361894-Chlamydomonas_euryale.AAC.14
MHKACSHQADVFSDRPSDEWPPPPPRCTVSAAPPYPYPAAVRRASRRRARAQAGREHAGSAHASRGLLFQRTHSGGPRLRSDISRAAAHRLLWWRRTPHRQPQR